MGRGRHHDHALTGEWADYRDCHVKPDLVLVFTDGVRATPCSSEENGGAVSPTTGCVACASSDLIA